MIISGKTTRNHKNVIFATCNCGCTNGVIIEIDEDADVKEYALMTYINSNWYRDQYGAFDVLKEIKKDMVNHKK